MKKIFVILGMFVLLCGCGNNKNNILDKFVKKLENTDRYILKGTMNIVSNEDTFTYNVEASKSKDGYYKADFTRIRDLAMFAINYERTYEREMIERPNNTVEDLELMIDHYYTLMRNDMLSEEEMEAYTDAINNLEQELEYTKAVTLNRSKKNETTGN